MTSNDFFKKKKVALIEIYEIKSDVTSNYYVLYKYAMMRGEILEEGSSQLKKKNVILNLPPPPPKRRLLANSPYGIRSGELKVQRHNLELYKLIHCIFILHETEMVM